MSVMRRKVMFKELYVSVLIFLATKSEVKAGDELSLHKYLFNESGYDKRVMPSVGFEGPLNVTIDLTVHKFFELEEKSQQLVTHGVFHQSWKDPNLVWNPFDYDGTESIIVHPRQVWFPDMSLYNSVIDLHARVKTNVEGWLRYDGTLTFKIPLIVRSLCKINLAYYPMDYQKCKLTFGSWSYHSRQIRVKSARKDFNFDAYALNGEWDLVNTTLHNKLYYYSIGHSFYEVTLTVVLRRRILYYAMYMIAPGMLIALFTATIFLLPQDCSERITLGMATLVALSFFFLIVAENMPASSSVSLIGGYYAMTMAEMAVSFFLNVLILRFHHTIESNVPLWVKKYILHYGAKFLRIKFRGMEKEKQSKQKDDDDKGGHKFKKKKTNKNKMPLEVFVADKVIVAGIQERKIEASRDSEWKKAAEVLNTYALIFYTLAVIITFGIFFGKALLVSSQS